MKKCSVSLPEPLNIGVRLSVFFACLTLLSCSEVPDAPACRANNQGSVATAASACLIRNGEYAVLIRKKGITGWQLPVAEAAFGDRPGVTPVVEWAKSDATYQVNPFTLSAGQLSNPAHLIPVRDAFIQSGKPDKSIHPDN